jgi:oligopeptide transport system substrate-binding protein
MKRVVFLILLLALLVMPITGGAQQTDPVTLRLALLAMPNGLDPASSYFSNEIAVHINLFLPLLRPSPTELQTIEPNLATGWTVSDDGLTYTFTLRDDVPWVRYSQSTGEVERLRMVTAEDAVYGIQHACSTLRNGYYAANVFGPVIAGCTQALDGRNPEEVVGARAIDDTTLEITLTAPGDYFVAMATLWTIAPVPREAIEGAGDAWTRPANIISNGPFVLTEWNTSSLRLVRNPHFPADAGGGGNIEAVTFVVASGDQEFQLFQNGELDRTSFASASYINSNSSQVFQFPSFLNYFGLANDKPPLDDPLVRRAFAAAIDRQAIERAIGVNGEVITHFAPDFLFGGVGNTEVGMGYDLEYARSLLMEAGYPECRGMPTLVLQINDATMQNILVDSLSALGCDDFTTGGGSPQAEDRVPVEDRPHIWLLGWGADYADADNFMSLLACGVNNDFRKQCTDIDDKIVRARESLDPNERIALYRELQEDFFGRNGEFPIIPLYLRTEFRIVHPDLTGPHAVNGTVGGERYDFYSIGDTVVQQNPPPQQQTPASTPEPFSGNVAAVDDSCTLTTSFRVNLRGGPGTNYERLRVLPIFNAYGGIGSAQGEDGFKWWQLDNGGWVRGDLVDASPACEGV